MFVSESENSEMSKEPDLIFIPQEARGVPIDVFDMSTRLTRVLKANHFKLMGDLHCKTFKNILRTPNCGQKTMKELRELVIGLQQGRNIFLTRPTQLIGGATSTDLRMSESRREAAGTNHLHDVINYISIPIRTQNIDLDTLPLSTRLESVLKKRGIKRLGQLHGLDLSKFRSKNFGRHTRDELLQLLKRVDSGEFQVDGEFKSSGIIDLLLRLEELIQNLRDHDRQILLMRFGGFESQPRTLEEIGKTVSLTRERVRQILSKKISILRRSGGARLDSQLSGIVALCHQMICPLTPSLLSDWIAGASHTPKLALSFHVQLLGEIKSDIPAWPRYQEPSSAVEGRARDIIRAVENVLMDQAITGVPLARIYELTLKQASLENLTLSEFLSSLKHCRTVVVEFPQSNKPSVRLRRLRLVQVAKILLMESTCPLTAEEILSRGQARFGKELVSWSSRSIANGLNLQNGFFFLGPSSFGLRQHLKMPEEMWELAKTDFAALLKKQNRPISTNDFVNSTNFPWTERTNAYELAEILRIDDRFIDLGRFLFALTEWGVEERDHIKDLLPRILQQAGRLMTSPQVLERLQLLRSASATGITSQLRKHEEIRDYGFGYYGLKSWKESVKEIILKNSALIERIIKRSEPPLYFGNLCEILGVKPEGVLSNELWQTCSSLTEVIRSPEKHSVDTRLIHRSCSLERALVAAAHAKNRALPHYEFQWVLNDLFGPLYADRTNTEIKRCLEQSRLFLRDANADFVLNNYVDQLDLDEEAICHACLKILVQSNVIVGCDDLIERLEDEGKIWENLSPEILGWLLRENEAFEEIGHNRFCANPCKH